MRIFESVCQSGILTITKMNESVSYKYVKPWSNPDCVMRTLVNACHITSQLVDIYVLICTLSQNSLLFVCIMLTKLWNRGYLPHHNKLFMSRNSKPEQIRDYLANHATKHQ